MKVSILYVNFKCTESHCYIALLLILVIRGLGQDLVFRELGHWFLYKGMDIF